MSRGLYLERPFHPEEDSRLARLRDWTASVLSEPLLDLSPASAGASFRRYFRAVTASSSHIVMDAPPSHEDCRPYLHVARLFRAAGANTPEILAENLAEGFLLLFHVAGEQDWTWCTVGGGGNQEHAIERCAGGGKPGLGSRARGAVETGR